MFPGPKYFGFNKTVYCASAITFVTHAHILFSSKYGHSVFKDRNFLKKNKRTETKITYFKFK